MYVPNVRLAVKIQSPAARFVPWPTSGPKTFVDGLLFSRQAPDRRCRAGKIYGKLLRNFFLGNFVSVSPPPCLARLPKSAASKRGGWRAMRKQRPEPLASFPGPLQGLWLVNRLKAAVHPNQRTTLTSTVVMNPTPPCRILSRARGSPSPRTTRPLIGRVRPMQQLQQLRQRQQEREAISTIHKREQRHREPQRRAKSMALHHHHYQPHQQQNQQKTFIPIPLPSTASRSSAAF